MKEKKKSAHNITSLPILPGTLFLCACTLLAFLGIFALLIWGGIAEMPEFITSFFYRNDNSDTFSEEFLAALSGNAPELDQADERLLTLSSESLLEVLLACEPLDNYYHRVDLTWTDGKGVFHRTEAYYIVSENRFIAEIYPNARSPKTVISNGTDVYFREGNSARILSRTDATDFSLESEIGIPTFSRMREMLEAAEEGAYTLSVETVQNSPCIRVTFTDTVSNISEIYDILPDYGLIVAAYSRLPGTDFVYYQMTTTTILTDLSGLDDSTFDIPNP